MALGDGISALATLGVTFGGFSPTLMDGIEASKEQVERFEEIYRKLNESKRKQRELEFARTSREMSFVDDAGSEWSYVVIDDSVVRIIGLKSAVKQVVVPSAIGGKSVYAIGSDALSENNVVEEIICSDTISVIGACAFRFNPNLRRVVLPINVSEYNSSWVSHCPRLEELVFAGHAR